MHAGSSKMASIIQLRLDISSVEAPGQHADASAERSQQPEPQPQRHLAVAVSAPSQGTFSL